MFLAPSQTSSGYWRLCTSFSFCCLLRSSVSRSEGRRCAISSSLCSSSLRCSSTRFSSGFSSSSRPLHSHPESRHKNPFCCSRPPQKKSASQSVDVRPAVPFVAEQQLPVEVLVAGCLRWGAVQLPGLSALVVQICCGLSEQCWVTYNGLWGVRYTVYHVTCDPSPSWFRCQVYILTKMVLEMTFDKWSIIWFVNGNKLLFVCFVFIMYFACNDIKTSWNPLNTFLTSQIDCVCFFHLRLCLYFVCLPFLGFPYPVFWRK